MFFSVRMALLIGFTLGSIAPTGAADLAYGEYLAGECMACHSSRADEAIPSIHALPEPYFIKALQAYKTGQRDHDAMQNVARTLGDAEIKALAAYFSKVRH